MYKHLDEMRLAAQKVCAQLNIIKQPRILLTNKLCPFSEDDYYEAGYLSLKTEVIRVRYTQELWSNHKDIILNTIAHELKHWRQYQNTSFNEAEYMEVYSNLDKQVGYTNNPLELDAVEFAEKLYPIHSDIDQFAELASKSDQKLIALIY